MAAIASWITSQDCVKLSRCKQAILRYSRIGVWNHCTTITSPMFCPWPPHHRTLELCAHSGFFIHFVVCNFWFTHNAILCMSMQVTPCSMEHIKRIKDCGIVSYAETTRVGQNGRDGVECFMNCFASHGTPPFWGNILLPFVKGCKTVSKKRTKVGKEAGICLKHPHWWQSC